ncbi:hypothetical protein [Erysipelothrix tonsillarum]|uniref:hypothetical protein n=1 Tax=Erysipelothrix tonsillarum TaxID=38402 RepID=UPI00037EA770|nr:hypothetical protein [Erysipelothrix tonsillarum]
MNKNLNQEPTDVVAEEKQSKKREHIGDVSFMVAMSLFVIALLVRSWTVYLIAMLGISLYILLGREA